jgi:putative peptidoglycan lipid II flippase
LLDWGLRLTLILALPSAAALAVLAVPLITGLFYYGHFSVHDVWMTRQAVIAYSCGLLGLIMVKVLAPGFYARQNIKTPVKIAVFTLVMTQLMNLLFVFGLQLHHAGLALSIGLAACLNAALLLWFLLKGGIYQPRPGWLVFLLKVGAAVGAMSLALHFAMGSDDLWLHISSRWRLIRLLGLVVLGVATYFAVLWALGFRAKDFVRRAVS